MSHLSRRVRHEWSDINGVFWRLEQSAIGFYLKPFNTKVPMPVGKEILRLATEVESLTSRLVEREAEVGRLTKVLMPIMKAAIKVNAPAGCSLDDGPEAVGEACLKHTQAMRELIEAARAALAPTTVGETDDKN